MKIWTIRIFDENDKQISFKNKNLLTNKEELLMQILMKTNSRFAVKKFAKAIINRTPNAISYLIKCED